MKKEKIYFRKIILVLGLLLAVWIVFEAGTDLLMDKTFTTEIPYYTEDENLTADDLTIKTDAEDIVQIESWSLSENQTVTVTLSPLHKGKVWLSIVDHNTQKELGICNFYVDYGGVITDMTTANFTNWEISSLSITILIVLIAVILWGAFFEIERKLNFSQQAIFCCGLGIWMTILAFVLVNYEIHRGDMINLYSNLESAATTFVWITVPVVVIFSLLLALSNLILIRHEGFRISNALGIGVAATLIGGFLVLFLLDRTFTGGEEFTSNVIMSLENIIYVAYALFECFLIGSVVCGIRAARHKPAYDQDYLIILGCKIRKDGTLYPLIRGRADVALRFYKEQLEKTGKKAVFIPSGGKGSDEVMAEGEAVARYLMEQGIEESQIRVENQSANTRQNMLFSKKIMDAEKPGAKAAFCTTNYHVFRSGVIARQVDFEADGVGGPTKWYFWPNAYIRETIGMITYKWKTLVLLFIPIVAFLTAIRFMF